MRTLRRLSILILWIIPHGGQGWQLQQGLSLVSTRSSYRIRKRSCVCRWATRQRRVDSNGPFVDDTDDDYYIRLYEEDVRLENGDLEEEESNDSPLLPVRTQLEKDAAEQDHKRRQAERAEWNLALEQLQREGVQVRQQRRRKVHQGRLAELAKKMARQALLQCQNEDEERWLPTKYKVAVGVYRRLLEELEERVQEAQQRAKDRVLEREAQLAALHYRRRDHDNDENEAPSLVDHLDYLESIQNIRNEEEKQRTAFVDLVLSKECPDNDTIQALSTPDLMAILKIRGNIKGSGRVRNRTKLLDLLKRSYEADLY